MSVTEVVGVGSTALGAAIAVVGSFSTWSANRRAQYERVLSETACLTTGDVAQARHRVGSCLETARGDVHVLDDELIRDVFTVLWAFERLAGLHQSLGRGWPLRRATRPQRLLLVAVRGAVATWYGYVGRTFRTPEDGQVSLEPAAEAVRELYRKSQGLGRP